MERKNYMDENATERKSYMDENASDYVIWGRGKPPAHIKKYSDGTTPNDSGSLSSKSGDDKTYMDHALFVVITASLEGRDSNVSLNQLCFYRKKALIKKARIT